MNNDRNETAKKLLAILAVAILVALIGHIVSVVSYNSQEHTVTGADENERSYMVLDNREDSTSSWLKRDFDLYGDTVDLSAQTFDGVFINNESHPVYDWTMTIRIKGQCFINNAWCGTVEIHQHAGTDGEKVQTVDLRNYDIDDIELDYKYDGDLLIPLEKGDYIIYYPSLKDSELPVAANSDLTIGMIFYYLDSIDLSDYEINYIYHKSYTEGPSFYAIAALAALWLIVLFAQIVASVSYKRAWKDAKLRKTGISYLAVIYDCIYIADLMSGELMPLSDTEDDPVHKMAEGLDPIEKLKSMFASDVSDEYGSVVSDFMDPATLVDRFEKDSIACEYISKTKGWCLIRLFAIDRAPGEPLRRFIFTIQNINEEKTAMDIVEDQLAGEEETSRPVVCERVEYSIRDILSDVYSDIRDASEKNGTEIVTDIARGMPEKFIGDPGKIRLALSCMLIDAISHTEGGRIKISVFAKETFGGEHILISVRDTGSGTEDEGGISGIGISTAAEVLRLMGSELHIIREEGVGSELYFELEQEIA